MIKTHWAVLLFFFLMGAVAGVSIEHALRNRLKEGVYFSPEQAQEAAEKLTQIRRNYPDTPLKIPAGGAEPVPIEKRADIFIGYSVPPSIEVTTLECGHKSTFLLSVREGPKDGDDKVEICLRCAATLLNRLKNQAK